MTLRTAFSRDQPQKRYVTHLILDDAGAVWELLEERRAIVYVCGDARNMAKDVDTALAQVGITVFIPLCDFNEMRW